MASSFGTTLLSTLRKNWTYYLAEAAGVGVFMVFSCGTAVLFNHPDSPVRQFLGENELWRRTVQATIIALMMVSLTYSTWGQRSGAHLNPAVTIAFWQLGSLRPADAFWYVLAQFGGALAVGGGMAWALARWYAHPDVKFNVTEPGEMGLGVALLTEIGISALLMLVLLWTLHSEKLRSWTGWLLAGLLGLYIVFVPPLSGMSLNPARSLGTAVPAGNYGTLWVYFVAPLTAMWLVAVLFQRFYHGDPLTCAVVAGCATAPEQGPFSQEKSEKPQFPDPEGEKK